MDKPKILFIDVETFPIIGYAWRTWDTNLVDIKDNTHLLSFSAKWYGGKQITRGLCDYPLYKKNKTSDMELVKEIWELLDNTDIVVAQNGDAFDIKKINTRFSFYNLKPPTPFKTIDTVKVARRHFAFDSNKLNDLCKFLGIGKKINTGGFELWLGCISGDNKSWTLMKKYNATDVILLEKLYIRLLPWIKNHPNYGIFTDKILCPNCGENRLQARGYAITKNRRYHRFQCLNCGSWGRDTNNVSLVKPIVSI